jgi:hypothetical protein
MLLAYEFQRNPFRCSHLASHYLLKIKNKHFFAVELSSVDIFYPDSADDEEEKERLVRKEMLILQFIKDLYYA